MCSANVCQVNERCSLPVCKPSTRAEVIHCSINSCLQSNQRLIHSAGPELHIGHRAYLAPWCLGPLLGRPDKPEVPGNIKSRNHLEASSLACLVPGMRWVRGWTQLGVSTEASTHIHHVSIQPELPRWVLHKQEMNVDHAKTLPLWDVLLLLSLPYSGPMQSFSNTELCHVMS